MSKPKQRLSTPAWIVAVVVLALSGVATMAAILSLMGEWRWPDAALYHGSAGAGAGLSAAVSVRFFGHRRIEGWCISVAGAVLATSIGGFCGGLVWTSVLAATDPAVNWPLIPNGALFCTVIVWMMIATQELVAVIWVASMVGVHLVMQWIRSVQL